MPADIPTQPHNVYREKGWVGWSDWLSGSAASGESQILPPSFRSSPFRRFEEAREFARQLGLKTSVEWAMFCHGGLPEQGSRPSDIPSNPMKSYQHAGWAGWDDWLGINRFRPFEEARQLARGLELKNQTEWGRYCNGKLPDKGILPNDIPIGPQYIYRDKGWRGWSDWLGSGWYASNSLPENTMLAEEVIKDSSRSYRREYRPFDEARQFARGLGLKNQTEWGQYCYGELHEKAALPEDIPKYPSESYRDSGWVSWDNWLGRSVHSTRRRRNSS